MKQRVRAIASLFLAAVMAASGLTGCVPDQSEFNYLFDYWCADWYGWYEISDATGKYAKLRGQRADCIAQSTYTYRLSYFMQVYDPEGEWIFEFDGDYRHEPEKEYGAVEFYSISFNPAYVGAVAGSESGLPYDIPVEFTVDGEDHGVQKLAVCKGTVGEGEDTLTMELYLRHWGVRWEDLKEYAGDAFGAREYPQCLPPDYAAYAAVFEEAELRERAETFWHREQYGWYGWYAVTDATGALAEHATAKTDCEANISVDRSWRSSLRYKYSIDLRSLDAGETDKGSKFSLYGPWEADAENKIGTIAIDRLSTHGTGRPAQGRANAADIAYMAVIRAQVSDGDGSMKIVAYLRPKGMSWEDLKEMDGEIIDGMTYRELLPIGAQE